MPITLNGTGTVGGVTDFTDVDGGNFVATSVETTGNLLVHEVSANRYTLRVDETNNTVGINTSGAPAAGTFLQIADATDPIVSLNNTANGEVRLGCGSAEGYIGTESNDPFVLTTQGNTRLRVQAAGVIETIGRLGVQEANPEVALQVTSNDLETCYLKRNGTLSATLTLLNTNDRGGFIQSRDNAGDDGGLTLGNYSGGSYTEKVRIGTAPTDEYSVITEAGRGSSEQYDAGRVRVNAGSCGTYVFNTNNTLASQSGRPSVFIYANSVPGWASFNDSVRDATQVLQLQKNNSVNDGYICQDQTVNFSINRWLEENNANPRTKLNITLRELGSTYSNFGFQGNGVIQLPNTAGAGIQFADYGTGANVSSNTLDDYEEGTFNTAAFNNTITYTGSLTGNYTKIGRVVYFSITYNNGTLSGATGGIAKITGLPFIASSDSINRSSFFIGYSNVTTNASNGGYVEDGTSNIIFYNAGTEIVASFSNGSAKYLTLSGFYLIN